MWKQHMLKQRIGQQDLLRAAFEVAESKTRESLPEHLVETSVKLEELLGQRSWTAGRVRKLLAQAQRHDLIWRDAQESYRFTPKGAKEARRAARNHRMWELFLIHHAEIAPAHVDRDADRIEHILEPAMIAELETLMNQQHPGVPESPHMLAPSSPLAP
jgi:manganese/zinc/iron transport system permease protein